jgi:hypothetical protein
MKLRLRSGFAFVGSALFLGVGCASLALAQASVGARLNDHAALGAEGRVRHRAIETVSIPGPLRSFLRMAGISQQVAPEEVMPVLARNVSLYGYEVGRGTEYLVLLTRYVHLARDIQRLSDSHGAIKVNDCSDVEPLIRVLGYKFEGVCGQKGASFRTADPERAFLTIDSGFPITELEQALERHQPFSYAFPSTQVPILFAEKDWTSITTWRRDPGANLIDVLLHDPALDRLYWALSRCDDETRLSLIQSPGLRKLASLGPAFDLYGSTVRIHAGAVQTPIGSERDWQRLADASPNSPGEFVTHLLTKDHGWLAAYFDALGRLNGTARAHLAEGSRLVDIYHAYRATTPSTDATSSIFPRNADLLILLTSLRWNASGDPDIPGGSALWQGVFSQSRSRARGAVPARDCCGNPERLLEGLVGSTNLTPANGPLQLFLLLNAIDSGREGPKHLSAATEELIASKFSQFNRWFSIFAEFSTLDDASVEKFIRAADEVEDIKTPTLRANALGAFQASAGLWQIFARQGQIPVEKQNSSWMNVVQPFAQVTSSAQLFDASRRSLQSLLVAVAGRPDLTQDEIVDLLAGPPQATRDGQLVHRELAERVRTVLDDQRLVSLDTLFALYDGLGQLAHERSQAGRLLPLAEELREFEMPRPIFTGSERSAWSPVVYSSRHTELQVRTDLTKVIQAPASQAQLEAARGKLVPFLRDTLVGLNYAYYEPPGAEVLHHNPLFVRSHDFSSISVLGVQETWADPMLIGVGATAGGGAYLMGSLDNLAYALASTEGEFIAPKNTQALIWQAAVPGLLAGSVLPRWWSVDKNELHAAALFQRAGEELLRASSTDPHLRSKVFAVLADRMSTKRLEQTESTLDANAGKEPTGLLLLPAESFYLATEFRKRYGGQEMASGNAGRELEQLASQDPSAVNPERISMDFGVPHPTLTFSNSCALFHMKPLPLYGGHAGGLLSESWESNNLYWARLADEGGYAPVMLNLLAPALTRQMVINIFASNVDDWPALFRAMQETGSEFRDGKINVIGVASVANR